MLVCSPSLKYMDCCVNDDATDTFRLECTTSPSLPTEMVSSELLPDAFSEEDVRVTESVNSFGVSEPVLDLVIIFLDSAAREEVEERHTVIILKY